MLVVTFLTVTIEYIGRLDHQVKIRGVRVELRSVELALMQHPSILQSIVVARPDPSGGNQLIAYWLPQSTQVSSPSSSELRRFLKTILPETMIPAMFIQIDTLPLTPNGKINRQALPLVTQMRPKLAEAFMPPATKFEHMMADIWQAYLHVDTVGIYDNFFDLGGHSLLMGQVIGKIQETLHTTITLLDFFKYPTIHSLASFLSKDNPDTPLNAMPGKREEEIKEGKNRIKLRIQRLQDKKRDCERC